MQAPQLYELIVFHVLQLRFKTSVGYSHKGGRELLSLSKSVR